MIVFGGIPTVMSNVMANLIRSVGASKKAGFGINAELSAFTASIVFAPRKERE